MSQSTIIRRRSTAVLLVVALLSTLWIPTFDLDATASGDPVDRAAMEQIVSANPSNLTPNVVGPNNSFYVSGLVDVGSLVVAGGRFNEVRNPGSATNIARTNIFAYDAATGVVDSSFAPQVNGIVDAVVAHPDGQSVFIVGNFTTVNGQPSFGLARLDLDTGARVPGFTTTTEGRVRDAIVRGNTLYLGGDFWRVGGQNRDKVAAVDVNTGAVRPLNVGFTDPRQGTNPWVNSIDVNAAGTELVAVGNFLTVGGQPREQIALLDLTSAAGSVVDWRALDYEDNCNINAFWTYMRDVEFSPDGEYLVIATTGGPYVGQICDTAARFESTDRGNVDYTWSNWSGGDTLTAVAVTDGAVYVGGHQRWMNNHLGRDNARIGAVNRPGISAVDPINGVPLTWNPGRDRGATVHTLHVTSDGDGLLLGHDTQLVAGENRWKIAYFPLGNDSIPAMTPVTLPADFYQVQTNGTLTRSNYDGTAASAAVPVNTGFDWSSVRGVTHEGSDVFYVDTAGTLFARSFDGTAWGPARDLTTGVYASTNSADTPRLTSNSTLTWDAGRLLFTSTTSSSLQYRWMSLESGILGSELFTVSTPGLTWSTTTSMEIVGTHLYRTRSDGGGNLYRINLTDGVPTGAETAVSGPGIDGRNWTGRDYFVRGDVSVDEPPSVSLTAPLEGATVSGSVTVSADASDDDAVVSVAFSVDDAPIGSDTDGSDGWSVTWDTTGVTNAAHTVAAVATDTAAQTATDSASVTVDNGGGGGTVLFSGSVDSSNATAPRWTSTVFTASTSGPETLTLDWGGAANLRFDVRRASDNVWVGSNSSTDQPKTITANLTAGTAYRIAVWSMSGAAPFTVTTGSPTPTTDEIPTVGVTSPADGATVGGTVTVSADASDDDAVDSVAFTVDGASIGTDTNGADGWSVTWDTTGVTNASHTVTATATDTAAQTATDSVGVTVDNGGGGGTVLFSGSVDSTNATAPRWTSTVFTASASGPETLTLDWGGAANLRFDVRRASDNVWLGSNLSTDHPKSITANLTAGTAYRIAVWSMSGTASFTVTTGTTAPTDETPTVSLTAPAEGATVSGSVTVTADASDDDAVDSVAFTVDGAPIGTDTNGADGWSVTWDTTGVTNASHTVTATATDTAAQTATDTSNVIVDNTVPVDDPPTLGITSPADGATVGGTVTIAADASDDDAVDSVEFSVDGTSVGTDTNGANGWSVDWDTTGVTNAAHTLTAVATDTAAQTATDSVNVTVDNAPVDTEGRPVILISVDGLRSSVLETADVPNWDRLVTGGATTLNARTVVEATQTLPNHTSIFSGRRVAGAGGHGVTFNEDNGSTVHASAGTYVASVFDMVHDAGMSTSFYTQKTKMTFYDRTWDQTNGAPDTNGDDNGADKIDVYLRANVATMVAAARAELTADPAELTFIHFGDTDFAGHDHGWDSAEYVAAVEQIDVYLGQILDDIESDPDLADAVVVFLADHGGTGTAHNDSTLGANYTIPFAVWGDGVSAGVDLYSINPDRADPGTAQPAYTAADQPIRNADAANLITSLHGLPAIPGSTINAAGDLEINGTPIAALMVDEPPTAAITAPTDASTVSGIVAVTADATDDTGVAAVEFSVDGVVIGTDTDGTDGWSIDWDTTAGGDADHTITVLVTDTADQTATDTATVTVTNGAA